ncbi:uncharacterized protein METZ01_LOCUS15981 [marine metagenome]|uniref:Uncharacterized protein n=1 Tax=marine metagenome TaxID=408172 RepID=A0A381P9V6_9ZZZZ
MNRVFDSSKFLNSAMHGLHQVAQRLRMTTLPFNSSNLNSSFSKVTRVGKT